jgi:hypothetical protein
VQTEPLTQPEPLDEGLTVTVIVYGPGAALLLTTKWPLITFPLLTVHADVEIGVPETEQAGENEPVLQAASPQLNCPWNPTVDPLPAMAGMSCIVLVGVPLTTKVASAESPPGAPTTVIVYVPGGVAEAPEGTVNDTTGVICPFEPMLHVVAGEPMIANGVLVIVHEVSVGLKPLPVTATS